MVWGNLRTKVWKNIRMCSVTWHAHFWSRVFHRPDRL